MRFDRLLGDQICCCRARKLVRNKTVQIVQWALSTRLSKGDGVGLQELAWSRNRSLIMCLTAALHYLLSRFASRKPLAAWLSLKSRRNKVSSQVNRRLPDRLGEQK